jgi:hypothetical protein
MSHEIQFKYFSDLFYIKNIDNLNEPFKSFTCEVPNLKFINNAQAGEFLSDVADWLSGSMYFRFFNPLYYMLETEIDKN